MKFMKNTLKTAGCALVAAAGLALSVSAADADRLGKDLTPVGAEKAGNADGSIPAWTGEGIGAVPEGYGGPGSHHPDPYAGEQPLYTITAANAAEYRDQLPEGAMKLFETYPDTFKMTVYPSHRTAQFDDWLVDNTRKCADSAVLAEGGSAVNGVHACYPFPVPKSGVEVLWNHLLRYQGIYRVESLDQASPDAKGRYITDELDRYTYFPYYDPDKPDTDIISKFIPRQLAPARVAGDTFLVIDNINPMKKPRQAWKYFAGQRRVRKAPVLVYDTPIPPSYGLRTVDTYDMYFGAPNKFEWKLVGKKEMIVPYNNYELGLPKYKNRDVLKPGHVNADLTRYEKHRVWVVEATLKDGERHIYPRRTLYVDEDTWMILYHDMYDKKGGLWRTAFNYPKLDWSSKVMTAAPVHHDLVARRYNAVVLMNEKPKTFDFSKPIPPENFFTPASIRRMGVR